MSEKDSKAKAIEALKNQQSNGDTEMAHCAADEILCEFLRELGHEDVVDEWDKVDKWYA